MQQVAQIRVRLAHGMQEMFTIKRKVDVDIGIGEITITSTYFIPGMNLNKFSWSRLDKHDVA